MGFFNILHLHKVLEIINFNIQKPLSFACLLMFSSVQISLIKIMELVRFYLFIFLKLQELCGLEDGAVAGEEFTLGFF